MRFPLLPCNVRDKLLEFKQSSFMALQDSEQCPPKNRANLVVQSVFSKKHAQECSFTKRCPTFFHLDLCYMLPCDCYVVSVSIFHKHNIYNTCTHAHICSLPVQAPQNSETITSCLQGVDTSNHVQYVLRAKCDDQGSVYVQSNGG